MKRNVEQVDFFVSRNNSPPHNNKQKLLLKSHEKSFGSGDMKKILLNKEINKKNYLIMKKTVLFILGMLIAVFSSFAQQATIDGVVCASSSDCIRYVCENGTISFQAGITHGSIDGVVWRERVYQNGGWSSYSVIGDSPSIIVPSDPEGAKLGKVYRYQLIVYQGGEQYFALTDVYVNSGPAATLLSDYTTICAGSQITFSASAGGTHYDFKVNGVSAYSGTNSSWSTSALTNGDQVTVTITGGGCSATSTPITMTVHSLPDLISVTPHSTCNGADMRFDYQGLTGTGPWTLSFWDPTHNTQYGVDYNVSSPNGSLDVLIPYGTSNVHLKIRDQHCANF